MNCTDVRAAATLTAMRLSPLPLILLACLFSPAALHAADEALASALLKASAVKTVRVETVDGGLFEGKLALADSASVRVSSGAGDEFVETRVMTARIRTIAIKMRLDREPSSIGGFIGGYAGGLIGFGFNDVNSFVTVGVGSALGMGFGFAFQNRSPRWRQIYPPLPPAADAFTREGWFTETAVTGAYVDAQLQAGGEQLENADWFLGGGGSLGWAVSPSVSLSFDTHSWLEPDFDLDFIDVYSTFTASGTWNPRARGFFVRAGAGAAVAEHNVESDALDASEWGWSATAATGYDFRVGKTTLLAPVVFFDYLRLNGEYFDSIRIVSAGLRLVRY